MLSEFHKGAPPPGFGYAKDNRQKATAAERLLWQQLRNRKFHGLKFRRQHPVSDFIADFYCHECNLIVELDGEYHNTSEQQQHDDGRTYELKALDLKIIRFTNREVLEEIDSVLRDLRKHLPDHSHNTGL